MKVRFEATFEEFVDVAMRSQPSSPSAYFFMIGVTVLVTGALAGLLHWAFGRWLMTIFAAVGGCVAGAWVIIDWPEKWIRDHLKKQIKEDAAVATEVELTDDGVTTRCLGHTVTQGWSTIEGVVETADAIYFKNKFGQYCSARKRGFESPDEMKQFIDLANSYLARPRD